MHIRKIDKHGKEIPEMEQCAVALFVWAYPAQNVLNHKKIAKSEALQKWLQQIANEATQAKIDFHNLDKVNTM